MVNQRENAISARGGIPVRDYTQEGSSLPISRGSRSIGGGTAMNNFFKVARALGWVSLGLGLVDLLMPDRVQRALGIRCGDYTGAIRAAGAREIGHALLINTQARPNLGVWSRVAGDAMDLSVMGKAFSSPGVETKRLTAFTAALAGLTALDLLTATRLSRARAEERAVENRYTDFSQADLESRAPGGGFHVSKSITINRSPEELYSFWRSFDNLPKFMNHLEMVQVRDDRRSHWVAKAPAGAHVEWEAEITEDRPNEMIAWQSTQDADVPNSGQVTFERAPGNRGTVVRVEIEYRPPGGALGKIVAKLFGEEPGQQVSDDLKRFKQVIETGEVVRSEGSPQGYGQKMQPPARPAEEKVNKQKGIFARLQKRERDTERERVQMH